MVGIQSAAELWSDKGIHGWSQESVQRHRPDGRSVIIQTVHITLLQGGAKFYEVRYKYAIRQQAHEHACRITCSVNVRFSEPYREVEFMYGPMNVRCRCSACHIFVVMADTMLLGGQCGFASGCGEEKGYGSRELNESWHHVWTSPLLRWVRLASQGWRFSLALG